MRNEKSLKTWGEGNLDMDNDLINTQMKKYFDDGALVGGALLVRKNGKEIYRNKWGYLDLKRKIPIQYDSIYPLMSMTKCITSVAVLKLIEEKVIDLDDEISKYIPDFKSMRVCVDPKYQAFDENSIKMSRLIWNFITFQRDKIKTVPAKREITIRDLLSHASGIQEGLVGFIQYYKTKPSDKSLEERVMDYSKYILDFHPGEKALYSPIAGFDILGYIVEKVNGMRFGEYLKKEIFEPLEMKDTTFFPSDEQRKRLATVYYRNGKRFVKVKGTKNDLYKMLRVKSKVYEAGCGGLYGTLDDYDHFVQMLCNEGLYRGRRILKPETVRLMRTQAQNGRLEFMPGLSWGLGVIIRVDPKRAGSFLPRGSYGWSGHYGTHFFICPEEKLTAVFMTNGVDGGSGSYVLKKIEELVFKIWG